MDNADTGQALVAGYVRRNFRGSCTARQGAVDLVFIGGVCVAFFFGVVEPPPPELPPGLPVFAGAV